jgi:hypothetical protein
MCSLSIESESVITLECFPPSATAMCDPVGGVIRLWL